MEENERKNAVCNNPLSCVQTKIIFFFREKRVREMATIKRRTSQWEKEEEEEEEELQIFFLPLFRFLEN